MSLNANELALQLGSRFPGLVSAPFEFRGEITVNVADASRIREVCAVCRKELGFNFLVDITSLDHYGDEPRFAVAYHLYGLEHRQYLRLKTTVTEEAAELPSVTAIWRTADWHEREIFDMMGIRFAGHPDLRRILMWEGYPHHPLRKDFPLGGKASEVPQVAFTQPAPLEGGPFVTVAGGKDAVAREPRVRVPDPEVTAGQGTSAESRSEGATQ